MEPIIEAIPKSILKEELHRNGLVRTTRKGDNEIYIVNNTNAPNVVQEIGIKLNSIATGIVYLSDGGGRFGFRDINPVRWVQKRGGLTDFKKYVKKFHKDKEPRTISI